MKTLLKIFNRYVWLLLSVFFVIAFVILMVGESFARENENNLNYALGINPWVMQTDETTEDTEYVKSQYVKKDKDGNILYQTSESGVRSQVYDNEAMRAGSMEISRKAAANGAVLLWNNDDTLPLKDNSRLSFFGVSSRANNWCYTGQGSGSVSVTKTDFMDLKAQFESEGKYAVNPTLYNSYPNTQQWKQVFNPYGDDNHYREFIVNEKAWSAVNDAAGSTFASYGDAAVYFISRTGAEDGDTWFDTSVYSENNDNNVDNNYLDLTENETDTIEALTALRDAGTFKKVILVLNTGTPMQMKTISKYDIDACLWAGMGGNASFGALYDVLSGKVNPSGRLVDSSCRYIRLRRRFRTQRGKYGRLRVYSFVCGSACREQTQQCLQSCLYGVSGRHLCRIPLLRNALRRRRPRRRQRVSVRRTGERYGRELEL